MANIIGTKKYLTAVVMNKKTGKLENRVLKVDSSNRKLCEKWSNHMEESIRRKNKLDKKV